MNLLGKLTANIILARLAALLLLSKGVTVTTRHFRTLHQIPPSKALSICDVL